MVPRVLGVIPRVLGVVPGGHSRTPGRARTAMRSLTRTPQRTCTGPATPCPLPPVGGPSPCSTITLPTSSWPLRRTASSWGNSGMSAGAGSGLWGPHCPSGGSGAVGSCLALRYPPHGRARDSRSPHPQTWLAVVYPGQRSPIPRSLPGWMGRWVGCECIGQGASSLGRLLNRKRAETPLRGPTVGVLGTNGRPVRRPTHFLGRASFGPLTVLLAQSRPRWGCRLSSVRQKRCRYVRTTLDSAHTTHSTCRSLSAASGHAWSRLVTPATFGIVGFRGCGKFAERCSLQTMGAIGLPLLRRPGWALGFRRIVSGYFHWGCSLFFCTRATRGPPPLLASGGN